MYLTIQSFVDKNIGKNLLILISVRNSEVHMEWDDWQTGLRIKE